MRRIPITPRPTWRTDVEADGLIFHTDEEEGIYWEESAYYEISQDESDLLEYAGNELHARCLEAVEHVIRSRRYSELRIPAAAIPAIEWAWENEPPSLYGRFDFVFDAGGNPRMLEYNADTPTTLLESAVIQWKWLEAVLPGRDQFNSIWEGITDYWAWCREHSFLKGERIHFATLGSVEDLMTIATLQDAAQQSGWATEMVAMDRIGWNGTEFVDQNKRPIRTIFKLYPWEWMMKEGFATPLLQSYRQVQWIEPIWKMILSNKGILAILWELFPDHPLLLPAYLDSSRSLERYVVKPLLSREGANVRIIGAEGGAAAPGPYAAEGQVFQEYLPLADYEGNRPVLGVWMVDAEARGLGIREADGPITTNLSRFLPHAIAI